MRRGLSGIDIFAPRDNGLPDFTKITPAQIFNGSAAAAINSLEETLGGNREGFYSGGRPNPVEGALGAAMGNSGGNFWGGVFNSAMDGAMDGLSGPGSGYGGMRQRYARIPGTDQTMEVRRARVVPEYLERGAARQRGHKAINDGGRDYSFESPPPPPLPQEDPPYGLPGESQSHAPTTPLVEKPLLPPPVYDPTDPMSATFPPEYGDPVETPQLDDSEVVDPEDGSLLLPPPGEIEMRSGAANRLPTRLLEELKHLYRV